MDKKPKKLVDLEIEAVAGVDKAANQRRFLVVKRAEDDVKPTFLERIASLFKSSSDVTPKTFDQALAGTKLDDTWWQLNDALRTSLRSIVESSAEDKGELIRASVAQYAEKLIAIAGEAGTTASDMQKMQDALVALGDADGDGVMAKVDEVEAIAKAWRQRVEKGDSDMDELNELLKGASQEVQDAVKAAMAKRDADLDALRKQVEELSKKTDGDDGAEGINKADLPEAVRKHLEDLEKQAREASEIAKAEREARVKSEVRKRAEGYGKVAEVDKLASLIYKAQSVDAEFAAELETVLKAADERIKAGALFDEFGTSGDAAPDNAWGKIEKAAEALQKSDPSLTRPEAIAKAMEQNPELEREYAKEVRG